MGGILDFFLYIAGLVDGFSEISYTRKKNIWVPLKENEQVFNNTVYYYINGDFLPIFVRNHI